MLKGVKWGLLAGSGLGLCLVGACGPAGGTGGEGTPEPGDTFYPSTPTATDVSTPTATARPDTEPPATPTATATATSTATPAEPTPTATAPFHTPTVTDTPETPTPGDDTPTPVIATPTPTATATATATPTPTATATPTPTPTATEVPDTGAPDDLEGTGFNVGDVAFDFNLRNQHGTIEGEVQRTRLYDYYGQVILLDFSAEWCGICRNFADDAEALYQTYREEGFIHLTVITQDQSGKNPTVSDLNQWVDQYGLTFPVMADEDRQTFFSFGCNTHPTFIVIGRDMTITDRLVNTNESALEAAIEDQL